MKSSKIPFPLVHKKSSLPTMAVLMGIIGSIPVLMVLWVAICSQFTKVEGTNETALYNVYVWMRALFAVSVVAGGVIYDIRRASIALLPASVLGLISSFTKLIIAMSVYFDKKTFADSMSMKANYTQNYIDMAEAAFLFVSAVLMVLYLVGLLKTGYPLIFGTIVTIIIVLYSVIYYSTIYPVSNFTVLSRCYAVPLCIGAILFAVSSKTKAQINGTVKKEKYVPRRMKA